MQKAIIDLSKNGIIPVFHAKQGDTSRRVAITLLDNGLPYDTAADAVSVWYSGPSGEGNYSDGIEKDGSTLTVLVNPNMTAASGCHTCAVMLSNESGRCTTWNFCVEVAYTPALGSEEAKAYFEAFEAGELAADIAAVDARTAKAVAELNDRVSAIIASGTATEGNTELIDIRTGADGNVYQTAGDAVRGQIGALKGDIANLCDINLNIGEMTIGKYLTTNGNLADDAGSKVSDYIYVGDRLTNTIKLINVFVRGSRCCASFNANKQFVRYLAVGTTDKDFVISLLEEEIYIRITSGVNETSIIKYSNVIKREEAYVDGENGLDTNDGTRYNPYKTIQKAVDNGHKNIYVNTSMEYTDRVYLYNKNGVTIQPWFYRPYDTTVPNNPKIKINCGNSINSGVIVNNCSDITLVGIETYNTTEYGFNIVNCEDIKCHSCVTHDTFRDGFRLVNVDGVFEDCTAYNIGDVSLVHADGFNIHGYGDTVFKNCVAHDCIDDGISHHDACTGVIDGGEYYNCGKGGVASPTHGAQVNVYGVFSHDNAFGVYTALEDGKTQKDSIIANNLLYNNTSAGIYANGYTLKAFGNVLRGNTNATRIENGGVLFQYESNQ